jgi:hypothetical protein
MATLDEELLQDQEENCREIAYIREQLPSDLKELYTDDQMVWMLDTIADYFFESGILESNDDEVDIDIDEVANYLCKHAKKEGLPPLHPDEVRFVVEADLDYQENSL